MTLIFPNFTQDEACDLEVKAFWRSLWGRACTRSSLEWQTSWGCSYDKTMIFRAQAGQYGLEVSALEPSGKMAGKPYLSVKVDNKKLFIKCILASTNLIKIEALLRCWACAPELFLAT